MWTHGFLHANNLNPRRATNNRKEPLDWDLTGRNRVGGKAQKFDLGEGGVYKPKLQQRATAYIQQQKGELWPRKALLDVLDGEEEEPAADRSDAATEWSPQDEEGGDASTSHPATTSCTGSQEFDEEEFNFQEMTENTYAVVLAPGKNEFSFTLKVGKYIPPWLHLVSGRDVREEDTHVLWRWHRPLQSGIVTAKNRGMDEKNVLKGFTEGRYSYN
ncbi:hypothetical protein CYMTET_7254 [Cymbomonas tetramitiformis]|uniref:Uncharacterized protein n=1 Tax=Cymbomonas tetramitiformis TaxID=36881 RepID=A0AAE0LH21_9CHLO|nr:hypothetical protein CYMTET_7254 [Cymbomonas tetramitiformis]